MEQDIKLKKICLKLFIAFFVILAISIVIQELFNGVVKDSKGYPIDLPFVLKIIINILIWMSAGISASAFTIWVSKRFDYLAKRKDLLNDFFYKSLNLINAINFVQPLVKGCDIDKVRKSYENFDENKHYWNELTDIRNRLKLSEDDNLLKNIDHIMEFFKTIIVPIKWNSTYIKDDLNDDEIRKICSNEPDIFDMGEINIKCIDGTYIPTIVYGSKIDNGILLDMQKIEKHLFDTVTLIGKLFPPYYAKNYTYIDKFGININPMRTEGTIFEEDDDKENDDNE